MREQKQIACGDFTLYRVIMSCVFFQLFFCPLCLKKQGRGRRRRRSMKVWKTSEKNKIYWLLSRIPEIENLLVLAGFECQNRIAIGLHERGIILAIDLALLVLAVCLVREKPTLIGAWLVLWIVLDDVRISSLKVKTHWPHWQDNTNGQYQTRKYHFDLS